MACFYPLDAWRTLQGGVTFRLSEGLSEFPLQLPCGRCTGCRAAKADEWALRCVHEAETHNHNSFITLTYEDKHLPYGGTLRKKDFQNFMKRLRKALKPKVRYMMSGEYGEDPHGILNPFTGEPQLGRPHFHAAIFGWHFPDREEYRYIANPGQDGYWTYTSEELTEIWGMGHCVIGDLNWQSARYVAGYMYKKINGKQSDDHYVKTDPNTGELVQVIPEYASMSLRPGIGYDWFHQHKNDFRKGFITVNGYKHRIPDYYMQLLSKADPASANTIRLEKLKHSDSHDPESQTDRLRVKEILKQRRQADHIARDNHDY